MADETKYLAIKKQNQKSSKNYLLERAVKTMERHPSA